MSKQIEALKLAEEAANRAITTLEYLKKIGVHSDSIDPTIRAEKKALAAIREALAEPVRRGSRITCVESGEKCVVWATSHTDCWVQFPDGHSGQYTYEQIGSLFSLDEQAEQEPVAWDLAEKVRRDLDRQSCPGAYMDIAVESIVNHCAAPVQPLKQEPVAYTNKEQLGYLKDPRYQATPLAMWASPFHENVNIALYAAPFNCKGKRCE